jgi:hypothetical protein
MEYLPWGNQEALGEITEGAINVEGKDVIILGGGDTGADCLGTAIRQGAKSVTQLEIMPRPTDERPASAPWPTYPMIFRVSSAHEELDNRIFSVSTEEFLGDSDGNLRALKLVETQFVNGQFSPVPGTEREIPAQFAFLAMGFKLGFKSRRAIMVALAGLVGGFISYLGVQNGDVAHQLDGFLLVVSYWVAPWIAVVLTERIMSKGNNAGERALAPKNSWAGVSAFVIATTFSIWGFCSQVMYTGPLGIAIHHITLDGGKIIDVPDLTAIVGFVLASLLFWLFSKADKNSK